jgi:hypothetical protein
VALVAEHGPEHVDAAPGKGQDGLAVSFAFGSFPLVVGAGGRLRWMLISAEV